MSSTTLRLKPKPKPKPIPMVPGLKCQPKKVEIAKLIIAQIREAKQKKKERILEIIAFLEKAYPACFNRGAPKPLKKGIHQEILGKLVPSTVISKRALHLAIGYYAHRMVYHQAIVDNIDRIDLEGTPVETVTELEKETAKKRIKTPSPSKK